MPIASESGRLARSMPMPTKGWDTSDLTNAISTGEATRTPDLRIMRPQASCRKPSPDKTLRDSTPPVGHHLAIDTCQTDSDLTRIVDAWPSLPESVRESILLLIKAAGK
jgi:hypothetical protein